MVFLDQIAATLKVAAKLLASGLFWTAHSVEENMK